MRQENRGAGSGRVRWTLLVLLWVWAACIALVLDLFLNVNEFDGIRPRAPLYRAMRTVAHEMVGEPYRDDPDAQPQQLARQRDMAVTRLPASATSPHSHAPAPLAPSESRHPGGKPDLRTPQGRKLLDSLTRAARTEQDANRRAAALRSIEAMFGPEILREVLTDRGDDRPDEQSQGDHRR